MARLSRKRTGEFAGSQKRFSQTMQTKGFAPNREGGTGRTGFTGVRLKWEAPVNHGEP
jgi:hypothetical protein